MIDKISTNIVQYHTDLSFLLWTNTKSLAISLNLVNCCTAGQKNLIWRNLQQVN